MKEDILAYNNSLSETDKAIAELLGKEIDSNLPNAENRIWHKHPVWFLDGNPIVGYSKLKILFVYCFGEVNHLKKLA